jgi:hypothetical protein
VRAQIGEAANRRHTAAASITLWAAVCAVAVIIIHAFTRDFGARLGSYRTGIITLSAICVAVLYSARKHSLWFSVRWLGIASRLPRTLALRIILFDRLEMWRFMHIAIGMLALLPFWWHTQAGTASLLEVALKDTVILMVMSGIVGAIIEDFLPHEMRIQPGAEVRIEDVDAKLHALYVEAEESILGHSEELVHAYLRNIRPILSGSQRRLRMLWATLTRSDPAPSLCNRARLAGAALGGEGAFYGTLVDLAEHKVRIEHNGFNLQLATAWIYFHVSLALIAGTLIAFHVAGVLYFAGI